MIIDRCPIQGILVNGEFTPASAYFLGSLLAGDESYRLYGQKKRIWLAITKHNVGYCTSEDLTKHFDLVLNITKGMKAQMYRKAELVMRNWFTPNKVGFAAAFEAPEEVTSREVCTFTESILQGLSLELKRCIVLGAFDGRSSIDINKATGDIRYIVLDCGNNDSMDILSRLLSQLGIRYNCNYARDRLEGGEPRKPQLRVAAASASRFAQLVGYISPARISILSKALGDRYTLQQENELLPGLTTIVFSSSPSGIEHLTPASLPSKEDQTNNALGVVETKPIFTQTSRNLFDESLVKEGTAVRHKTYGSGIILSLDGSRTHIAVRFSVGERTFVYPDAFNKGFLMIE